MVGEATSITITATISKTSADELGVESTTTVVTKSWTISINAYVATLSELTLTLGEGEDKGATATVNKDDSVALNLSGLGDDGKAYDVTNETVVYTVTDGEDKHLTKDTDYSISNGGFTPKAAGTYKMTASVTIGEPEDTKIESDTVTVTAIELDYSDDIEINAEDFEEFTGKVEIAVGTDETFGNALGDLISDIANEGALKEKIEDTDVITGTVTLSGKYIVPTITSDAANNADEDKLAGLTTTLTMDIYPPSGVGTLVLIMIDSDGEVSAWTVGGEEMLATASLASTPVSVAIPYEDGAVYTLARMTVTTVTVSEDKITVESFDGSQFAGDADKLDGATLTFTPDNDSQTDSGYKAVVVEIAYDATNGLTWSYAYNDATDGAISGAELYPDVVYTVTLGGYNSSDYVYALGDTKTWSSTSGDDSLTIVASAIPQAATSLTFTFDASTFETDVYDETDTTLLLEKYTYTLNLYNQDDVLITSEAITVESDGSASVTITDDIFYAADGSLQYTYEIVETKVEYAVDDGAGGTKTVSTVTTYTNTEIDMDALEVTEDSLSTLGTEDDSNEYDGEVEITDEGILITGGEVLEEAGITSILLPIGVDIGKVSDSLTSDVITAIESDIETDIISNMKLSSTDYAFKTILGSFDLTGTPGQDINLTIESDPDCNRYAIVHYNLNSSGTYEYIEKWGAQTSLDFIIDPSSFSPFYVVGMYYTAPTVSNPGSTGGSTGSGNTYNAASYYDSGSVRVNGAVISQLQNVLVGELVNLDLITTVNGREVLGWYYDSALTNQITNTSQFVITSDMIANGLFVKLAGASDTLVDGSTNAGAGTTTDTYVPSNVPSTIAKLLGKLF